MCSRFYNYLIYRKVFLPFAPRSKFVKIALLCLCSEGERSLLLQKEWGNDGETRLLRKECRIDFRRKSLSCACSDGERPLLLRKEWGKAGEKRLLRKECRIDLLYGESGFRRGSGDLGHFCG